VIFQAGGSIQNEHNNDDRQTGGSMDLLAPRSADICRVMSLLRTHVIRRKAQMARIISTGRLLRRVSGGANKAAPTIRSLSYHMVVSADSPFTAGYQRMAKARRHTPYLLALAVSG
jgi:hypothetical protein